MKKIITKEERQIAVDIDDLFEALGGTWRIHTPGSKYKFIYGVKMPDNGDYVSYFEFYDSQKQIRVRYEQRNFRESLEIELTKPTSKKVISSDDFWDEYARQLIARNITFDEVHKTVKRPKVQKK